MEYTINKLAALASISTRTLRYYDQIGLLKPGRVNSTGYRIYGDREVNLLQQILFFRELDLQLEDIRKIITSPDFDISQALADHHQKLISKRNQLDQLIQTVEKTIAHQKGEKAMSNREKFEGFKRDLVAANEKQYGSETREKFGAETVEALNRKFLNLSETEYQRMQAIESEMFDALRILMQSGDLESDAAKTVCEKHKEWLSFTWPIIFARSPHRISRSLCRRRKVCQILQ